jgi:biopolymer transport protein ExbD
MKRERFEKMNVVPFIDIVLVLLVMVLATASFITQRTITVDLPKGGVLEEPLKEKEQITLAITKEGQYVWEKELVSFEVLKERLKSRHLLNPEVEVLLHTDKKSLFGDFVALMDFLKREGFENMRIVTKES